MGTNNVRRNKKCSSEQKMFVGTMFSGTKNVPISQNKVHKVPIAMEAKCSVAHSDIDKCLPCMALCGLLWPHMALFGLMWPHMVFLLFTARP